jgi:hypothetical protein
MPFTPRPAYPVAIWEEPPLAAAAFSIGALMPYLLTDGSVEFLAPADAVPSGAVVATVADSGFGYDQIVSGVSTGRRPILRATTIFLV